jgi:hypothetical protein
MSSQAKHLVRLAIISTVFLTGFAPAAFSAPRHASAFSSQAAVDVVHEINSIRMRAGLPPARVVRTFNGEVIAAASLKKDPALNSLGTSRRVAYALWGIVPGDPNAGIAPASVVKQWVFEDGWRGVNTENVDCTGPRANGCNGHRRAVLSTAPFPGAKLSIDVAVRNSSWEGARAVSVAALMIWT